jgi:FkbM family methyltransferase
MFLGLFEPTETRLVRELLTPGDTFVDVGAHIGWFTTLASKQVGAGHVESIEPFGANLALLKLNMDNNECKNVRISETAVGSEVGKLQLAGTDSGGVTALPWASFDGKRVSVPMVRMDDLGIDRNVSLMKIDVEGWEMRVLQGGAATLSGTDNLLIEVTSKSLVKAGSSSQEIFDILTDAGFTGFYRVGEGALRERYLQRSSARAQNVLATRIDTKSGVNLRSNLGLSRKTARRLRPISSPQS